MNLCTQGGQCSGRPEYFPTQCWYEEQSADSRSVFLLEWIEHCDIPAIPHRLSEEPPSYSIDIDNETMHVYFKGIDAGVLETIPDARNQYYL